MGAAAAARRRARRRASFARDRVGHCAPAAQFWRSAAAAPAADPRPPSLPSRTVSYHTPNMRALQV